MIRIGVSGYSGAGKDEVAKALARRGFERVGWFDAAKDEVTAILSRTMTAYARTWYPARVDAEGITAVIYDLLWVHRDDVTRALLQEWGTDLRRHEDPDYWVKAWRRGKGPVIDRVVVPDTRFPNEAETIKSLGGWVIRVDRPGVGPKMNPENGTPHISETAIDEWAFDARIQNDGTLAALEDQVDRWLAGTLRDVGGA